MRFKKIDNKTRIYRIWQGMRQRCYNRLTEMYKYCGAKGIVITPEWENFIGFKNWAINTGYNDTLFLKRKDNNGDFEPDNCTWVDKSSNCLKNVKIIEFKNKKVTYKELSEIYDIKIQTLKQRYYKGWRDDKLIKPLYFKKENEKCAK